MNFIKMIKFSTLQEWLDIQKQEYNELLESMRTIDNINFVVLDKYNKDDHLLAIRDKVRGKYSHYHNERFHAITINGDTVNVRNPSRNDVRTIVHEIIHFLDFNNVRYIYPSNIYNINRKLREADINFNINTNVFLDIFDIVGGVDNRNYYNYLMGLEDVVGRDYISIILRVISRNVHKRPTELRAYIGAELYCLCIYDNINVRDLEF